MKKHLFIIFTIFHCFFIPVFVVSDSIETVFSTYFNNADREKINMLITTGRIDNIPENNNDFSFFPEIFQKNIILDEIKSKGFTTAIESVFLIPVSSETKNLLMHSFSVLTDVETMNGIKYYSASRKTDRVLFNEVYFVDNESSGRKITFRPPENPDSFYSFTAYVHDNTFGKNYFYNNYIVSDNYILMKMGNLNRLTYGFLPVIKKDDFVFYMIIIPADNYLLLYCSGITRTLDNDFIRNRINQSIHNRVSALYNWFSLNFRN